MLTKIRFSLVLLSLLIFNSFTAIADDKWVPTESTGELIISIEGFSGPEAVRYDSDQDIYFVSNWNS